MNLKKPLFCATLISFLIIASFAFAETSIVLKNIYVDMSLDKFFKVISKNKLNYTQGQYNYKEKIGNLSGEWTFIVKDKKIDWFVFSYNTPDFKKNINYKSTYNMLLKETNSIINELTKLFGNPGLITKIRPYENPFKKFPDETKVYSSDILRVKWSETSRGAINVEYYMYSNKGLHWINVSITFHKIDYLEKNKIK